jgi:hypothetical protein
MSATKMLFAGTIFTLFTGCSMLHKLTTSENDLFKEESANRIKKYHLTSSIKTDYLDSLLYAESKIHSDSDAILALQEIKDSVKKNLKIDSIYSASDAITTLQTIDQIIVDMGYDYEGGFSVSKGIINKKIDCDIRTMIYLSIAKDNNLPISGVLYPDHMNLVWQLDNNNYFRWETSGTVINESRLNEEFDKLSPGEGRSLTEKELDAYVMWQIGNSITEKIFESKSKNDICFMYKSLVSAAVCYTKAHELFPEYVRFTLSLAMNSFYRGNAGLANKYLDEALTIDPENSLSKDLKDAINMNYSQ